MSDQISSTLAAASKIVQASELPLRDDHDATVEIVAGMLSTFSSGDVAEFVERAASSEIATQIVYAALESEASADDGKTVSTLMVAEPVTASEPVQADVGTPAFQPMTAMLTIIKHLVLPLAERAVELEGYRAEQAGLRTRLGRLEESVAALST